MATNGESARQWLADKGSTASPDELLRIRTAIANKLDTMPEDHPDEAGLLEALDVMDEFMEKGKDAPLAAAAAPLNSPSDETSAPALDTSPLIPDLPPAEELSPAEKQARFQALLKKTHIIS
ncbi:hypothetical protein [Sansalvadorimonas verongulae]|uniref:hypothetical protein n=1 Tax=Sansalvadorimonas verongulae TaxID=2172824 RepID=UPI0012BC1A63|nr:hypothetical protein [Sansalvadorimonas verongulae]MTI12813.1 hypothetical protein [Sansalvadorimonas verongulae]